MKTKTIGIVIAILGILMIIYTGFSYVTTEKVVDLGLLELNVKEKHPIQWSPIVGVILLVGGIVIVAFDRKK
jgi:uncharacterized membrane protein YidH (DUF202 family)